MDGWTDGQVQGARDRGTAAVECRSQARGGRDTPHPPSTAGGTPGDLPPTRDQGQNCPGLTGGTLQPWGAAGTEGTMLQRGLHRPGTPHGHLSPTGLQTPPQGLRVSLGGTPPTSGVSGVNPTPPNIQTMARAHFGI